MMGLLGLSLGRRLAGCGTRHNDFGVAQHALVLAIALAQHADDRMWRYIVPCLGLYSDV
jgi:hypothetical protein